MGAIVILAIFILKKLFKLAVFFAIIALILYYSDSISSKSRKVEINTSYIFYS